MAQSEALRWCIMHEVLLLVSHLCLPVPSTFVAAARAVHICVYMCALKEGCACACFAADDFIISRALCSVVWW
jgi:hypothetical protein